MINYGIPQQNASAPQATQTPQLSTSNQQVPLDQSSGIAGNPSAPLVTPQLAPGIGMTNVPGIGMLGPDLGGAVKGDLLKQQFGLNEAKNIRENRASDNADQYLKIAQSELGIKQSELAMKQTSFAYALRDKQRQESLIQGINDSAKAGGFSGVVDFLKTHDPKLAMEFYAQKLALDASIMKNDVMQVTSKKDISNAMLESYGVMGKIGLGIANAPEKDRPALYQNSLPYLRKIDPNMPDNYGEGIPRLMLATFQGTPANILYKNNATMYGTGSAISDLGNNIATTEKKYQAMGKDPNTDPTYVAMVAQRKKLALQGDTAALQNQEVKLKVQNQTQQNQMAIMKNTEDVQKNFQSLEATKSYDKFMSTYSQLSSGFRQYKKDPNNPALQGMVGSLVAGAVQIGIVTDPDYDRDTQGIDGWAKVKEKIKAQMSGRKYTLSPWEMGKLNEAVQAVSQGVQMRQLSTEHSWIDGIQKYGDLVKIDALRMPSKTYDELKMVDNFSPVLEKYGLNNLPSDIQLKAARLFSQGRPAQQIVKWAAEWQTAQPKTGIESQQNTNMGASVNGQWK